MEEQITEKIEKVEKRKFDINMDDSIRWYRKPMWIQTVVIALIPTLILLANFNSIVIGLATFWIGFTGMNIGTLFLITFIGSVLGFLYFFATTFYMGGINNKIIYAKIFKKKIMPYLDSNYILRFFVPETNEKTWYVKNIGEFGVNPKARIWLPNGVIGMLTMYGYPEGIDLSDIKHRCILKTDSKILEDRNREVKLEAMEEVKGVLNPKTLMYIIPVILIVGIVGYLIISTLQTGACQSQLSDLAMKCGSYVQQSQNVTTTTATLPFGIPNMPLMK